MVPEQLDTGRAQSRQRVPTVQLDTGRAEVNSRVPVLGIRYLETFVPGRAILMYAPHPFDPRPFPGPLWDLV